MMLRADLVRTAKQLALSFLVVLAAAITAPAKELPTAACERSTPRRPVGIAISQSSFPAVGVWFRPPEIIRGSVKCC